MSRWIRFIAALAVPTIFLIQRFASSTNWPLSDTSLKFFQWQHWLSLEWKKTGLPLWRSDLSLEAWLQPESGMFSFLTLPIFHLSSDRVIILILLTFSAITFALGTFLLSKTVAQRTSLALIGTLFLAAINFWGQSIFSPHDLLALSVIPWFLLGLVKWSFINNLRSRIFMTAPLTILISLTHYSTFVTCVLIAIIYCVFLFDRNRPRSYLRFWNVVLSAALALTITCPIWWPVFELRENLFLPPLLGPIDYPFFQGQWVSSIALVWGIAGLYWTKTRRHWAFHALALAAGILLFKISDSQLKWAREASLGFLEPLQLKMSLSWILQISFSLAGLVGIKRFWAKFTRTDGVAYVPGAAAILNFALWLVFLKLSKSNLPSLANWTSTELAQRSTIHFMVGIGFGLVSMYVFFIKDSRGTIRQSVLLLTAALAIEGNYLKLVKIPNQAAAPPILTQHFQDIRLLGLNDRQSLINDSNLSWNLILKNSPLSISTAHTIKLAVSEIEAVSMINERGLVTDPVIAERRETYVKGSIMANDPAFWPTALSKMASDSQSMAAQSEISIFDLTNSGNDQKFSVASPSIGIVVLRQHFSPFRKIQVDNKEVPSFRADYLNQGFFVPPGSHQILVTYETRKVKDTFPVAYFGILIYMAWLLLSLRQKTIDTWVPEIRI